MIKSCRVKLCKRCSGESLALADALDKLRRKLNAEFSRRQRSETATQRLPRWVA